MWLSALGMGACSAQVSEAGSYEWTEACGTALPSWRCCPPTA